VERALRRLSHFVKPKQYRLIEGARYDAAACEIADASMESIGRIDLDCAEAIHDSVEDGVGITEIERETIRLFLKGGSGDVLFIVDDDARVYLLGVLGVGQSADAENANREMLTPPRAVEVRGNAPASALHSALKKAPTLTPRKTSQSGKKKGVAFTPMRRFETRTYVPSPENASPCSDSDDDDDDDDDKDAETFEEDVEEPIAVEAAMLSPLPRGAPSMIHPLSVAMTQSTEFWLQPVRLLDATAACLATLSALFVTQFCIIAHLQASMTPA
jgi:hypothetical protein